MNHCHVVVICDPDRHFSHKLEAKFRSYFRACDDAEGKTRRRSVEVLSSRKELLGYLRRRQVDLIVLHEDFAALPLGETGGAREVVLKTTDVPLENPDCFVNRNEGVTNIVKEIISMGEEFEVCKTEAICVYSSVGCRAQSSFAYFLARNLAKEKRVLYLSLVQNHEPMFPVASPGEREFRELLNVMNRDMVLFRNKVKRMMCKQGNMYYLSPGVPARSLIHVESTKWQRFWEYFRSGREFDYIIIEATDYLKDIRALLRGCDRVFMMEASDKSGPDRMKMEDNNLLFGDKVHVLPHKLRYFMLREMAEYVQKTIGNRAL